MKCKKHLLTFLLAALLATGTSSQTGIYVPELRALDSLMLEFLDNWEIPGAAVAVVKDGRLVYNRGFGFANLETQVPVQPHHRFRIASVSKPVTAAAALKLAEDGQLSLNDLVFGENGILNDSIYADLADPLLENITVRMLLQHTAGWERYGQDVDPMFSPLPIAAALGVTPPPTPSQILQYMTGQPLDYVPGTEQAYQNFGYSVLGRVIEKVSGQPYEEYVQQAVLLPAGATGMQLGRNLLADTLPNEVVYYHLWAGATTVSMFGDGAIVPWQYGGFNVEGMDAHGGWIASAEDLARFLVATDGFDTKPDVLSATSIAKFEEKPFAAAIFGMGWSVLGDRRWHFGAMHGTSAYISRRDDGLEWAILFNATRGNNLFYEEWDEAVFTALNSVDEFPAHDLFEPVSRVENASEGGSLTISLFPNPASKAVHIAYLLEKTADVRLEVVDVLSQKVAPLFSGKQMAGSHEFTWNGLMGNGLRAQAGVYFVRLVVGDEVSVKKIFWQ